MQTLGHPNGMMRSAHSKTFVHCDQCDLGRFFARPLRRPGPNIVRAGYCNDLSERLLIAGKACACMKSRETRGVVWTPCTDADEALVDDARARICTAGAREDCGRTLQLAGFWPEADLGNAPDGFVLARATLDVENGVGGMDTVRAMFEPCACGVLSIGRGVSPEHAARQLRHCGSEPKAIVVETVDAGRELVAQRFLASGTTVGALTCHAVISDPSAAELVSDAAPIGGTSIDIEGKKAFAIISDLSTDNIGFCVNEADERVAANAKLLVRGMGMELVTTRNVFQGERIRATYCISSDRTAAAAAASAAEDEREKQKATVRRDGE